VFTICYQLLQDDWVGMVVCAIVFVVATFALFFTFRQGHPPASYRVSDMQLALVMLPWAI
jgi:hypothetical protein